MADMSTSNTEQSLIANSMDPDETARMRMLIWIHPGRKRTRYFLVNTTVSIHIRFDKDNYAGANGSLFIDPKRKLLIAVFKGFTKVTGESIENVKRVLNEIFSPSNYDKEIRGQLDLTQTTDVNLKFMLKNINKLDELEETFEAFGVLFLEWRDERLIWDQNKYNGTTHVYITAEKIWRPELALENPSTSGGFFGDPTRLLTTYKSNGLATMIIGDVFRCSCSVDLTSFPWDKQTCGLVFVAWGYLANEVKLKAAQKTIGLDGYQSNGVWDLLSTKVFSKDHSSKSHLVFEVALQRRPTFFIVNILIPIVTLSVLNVFVFIIPVDSGERVTFSLTVLLSIAVFMTLVSDNLPPVAESTASICYLLLFVLIQSALFCLLNIVSVKLYLRQNDSVQICKFWRRFLWIFYGSKRNFRPRRVDNNPEASDELADATDKEGTIQLDSYELDQKYMSWKHVSNIFDKVVSIFMTMTLLLAFSMYTYYVVTG